MKPPEARALMKTHHLGPYSRAADVPMAPDMANAPQAIMIRSRGPRRRRVVIPAPNGMAGGAPGPC